MLLNAKKTASTLPLKPNNANSVGRPLRRRNSLVNESLITNEKVGFWSKALWTGALVAFALSNACWMFGGAYSLSVSLIVVSIGCVFSLNLPKSYFGTPASTSSKKQASVKKQASSSDYIASHVPVLKDKSDVVAQVAREYYASTCPNLRAGIVSPIECEFSDDCLPAVVEDLNVVIEPTVGSKPKITS